MIIISGPGRSGTSVLAKIYDNLGFQVPGRWNDRKNVNAGYEALDVSQLNQKMVIEVGGAHPAQTPTWIDWTKQGKVAEGNKAAMLELEVKHRVLKDPRFCITARLWQMAGVKIDFVAICTRQLEAMRLSRVRMNNVPANAAIHNAYAYEVGLLVSACVDYQIPFSVLRFPTFLQDPDRLHSALRFPDYVKPDSFAVEFDKAVSWGMVHDKS